PSGPARPAALRAVDADSSRCRRSALTGRMNNAAVTDTPLRRVCFPMRQFMPLLLLMNCTVAQRPPPPSPPFPRFSLEAEQHPDANLCRRMADWDCADLDCPDCSSVAQRVRTRDIGEFIGAVAALC